MENITCQNPDTASFHYILLISRQTATLETTEAKRGKNCKKRSYNVHYFRFGIKETVNTTMRHIHRKCNR